MFSTSIGIYWSEASTSLFQVKSENVRLLEMTILREIIKHVNHRTHRKRTCNVVKSCATPQTRQKVPALTLA